MKISLAGIQAGLVWFFGFVSGIGFMWTAVGIINNWPVLHIVVPSTLFLAGIVFGGLVSRTVMARIAKHSKK